MGKTNNLGMSPAEEESFVEEQKIRERGEVRVDVESPALRFPRASEVYKIRCFGGKQWEYSEEAAIFAMLCSFPKGRERGFYSVGESKGSSGASNGGE